jgi:hypothetical protein
MGVVVLDVGVEHCCEVAAAADEHPVEALSAHRADETFGVRVGPRRTDRGSDDPQSFTAHDLIERGRELRVAVTDKEPATRETPTEGRAVAIGRSRC